ncbi:MAG: biotin--[acetyl-CoA-carboxylase] ligase [Flavobacteriaceae bacterium]
MNIIKLSAIDSTNDFLLNMADRGKVEQFQVVQTDFQTKGRGQFGKKWESKPGENLMFSLFFQPKPSMSLTELNQLVALSIIDALKVYSLPNLSIKWPNDILSGGHKIAGILIETKLNNSGIKHAVIGLGLNVNQTEFNPKFKATSLKQLKASFETLDQVSVHVIESLISQLTKFNSNMGYKESYERQLFGLNRVRLFIRNSNDSKFQAIIKGINQTNELILEHEDGTLECIKNGEIKYCL